MADATDATDAEILFPGTEIIVAGETITVREFSYGEAIRYASRYGALLARIADEYSDDGGHDLDAVIASHPEEWLFLVAQSCGKPVEWFDSVGQGDGQSIALAAWQANPGFFCRLLWKRAAMKPTADQSA